MSSVVCPALCTAAAAAAAWSQLPTSAVHCCGLDVVLGCLQCHGLEYSCALAAAADVALAAAPAIAAAEMSAAAAAAGGIGRVQLCMSVGAVTLVAMLLV